MNEPDMSEGNIPIYLDPDRLPAGLTCLAIAYPAVAAAGHAWSALAVGISSLAVLLLTWCSLQLLRRWSRFPRGRLPVVAIGCAVSSLVWLVARLPGWIPVDAHPLPMLAAPLLLLVQSLSLLNDENDGPIYTVPLRLAGTGAFFCIVLVSIGILREGILYGTFFGSVDAGTRIADLAVSIPVGLILAGLTLGGLRWLSGKGRGMSAGGSGQ